MKNFIIFSENNEFVSNLFDRNFLNNNKLDLKCIISARYQNHLISENFREIDIFTHEDFEKGTIDKIESIKQNEVDEEILKEFNETESLSIKFLDFYNPQGDKFTLREARQAYYHSLVFVLNFLKKYNPGLIFFSNVPHSFTGIILASVCKKKKIKIIFKREISIPGRFIFQNDLFETNLGKNLSKNNDDFKNIIDENKTFFEKFREKILTNNTHEVKKVFSIKRDRYLLNNLNKVKKFYFLFLFIFFIRQIFIYFPKVFLRFSRDVFLYLFISKKKYRNQLYLEDNWKSKNKLFKDSNTLKILRDLELFKSDFRKYDLLSVYSSICEQKIDIEKKFVYFALHYQPEATTYPFGNYFIDQINAIKLLSAYLPQDYYIYVKEHPDTFNVGRESWVIGDFSRDKNFYKELQSIENVKLVSPNMSSLDSINKAEAISTIAGAVGLESILINKPAILFGSPWYKNCEGTFEFNTHNKCKEAIKNLVDRKPIDKNKINQFFYEAENSVFDDKNLILENNLRYIQKNFIENII